MFTTIKHYLYIGAGLLVAGLIFAVKILTTKNSQLRTKVEIVEAKVHHGKVVNEMKKENEKVYRGRTAELAKELEEKKTSSELEKPNKDW